VKSVEEFIYELEIALHRNIPYFTQETFLHTGQSFKAYFYIRPDLFLNVRYNAVNGRTDVALIHMHERVFGYDNLKEWHYHPFENPKLHIPCDEPSLEFILNEISQIIKQL